LRGRDGPASPQPAQQETSAECVSEESTDDKHARQGSRALSRYDATTSRECFRCASFLL